MVDEIPKKAYPTSDIGEVRRNGIALRKEHVSEILLESADSDGGQLKNFKAYIFFFGPGINSFDIDKEKIENGLDNEYKFIYNGNTCYFIEREWGIIAYHALGDDATRKIETFFRNNKSIRKPWINKSQFEKLIQRFITSGGRVVEERGKFKPYEDYSGYGITIDVTGVKAKEIFDEIEKDYPLLPKKAKIELDDGDDSFRFEFSNNGRISFYSGPIDIWILIIQDYEKFIRNIDDVFDFNKQPRWVDIEGCKILETSEIINLNLPSLDKIGGSIEERMSAIISLLTSGKGTYGFTGIPISSDRASIVDLKEGKLMEISINEDGINVYSENPSDARPSIRKLISEIAIQIDPDVGINIIKFGEN